MFAAQQTAGFGHISKGSVAIVPVKQVLAELRDKQVVVAIIVVVAHGYRRSHPVCISSALLVTSVNVPFRLL